MPEQKKQQGQTSPSVSTETSNPKAEIEQLYPKAEQKVTDEDLGNIRNSTAPAHFNLEECWYKAKIFDAATKRAENEAQQARERTIDFNERERKLGTKKQELEQESDRLNQQKDKLQRLEAEIAKREALLGNGERELWQRELNAEAGFVSQNRAALAELENQTQELRQTREQLYKDIAEKQKQLDVEIAQRRAEVEQELAAERQEILASRNQLAEESREGRLELRRVETERELLEEDKQGLEKRIERIAAGRIEQLQVKIEVLEERLRVTQQQREQFQSKLIQRAEADRRFGQKTPEEVLEELENLRRDRSELEEKLASRLSENATARLQELESQKEEWETERFRFSTKVQELERKIANNRIAVTELETLRDEKEALEASKNRLRSALQELKAQVDDAVAQSRERSPFPHCVVMDNDPTLQTEITVYEDIADLKEFAEDLRYRIALSPSDREKRLYYSGRDIRAFLAGLAMSKLHILQGISGTGKTSLPVAFSRAVKGEYKLVEVQAGWRDRQDLLGYFNAFEGRFYESDFLKALYSAQCPANRERIYIIVLDEMNLSRPEQYFADFLSKLEQDAPTIGLTTDLDKPSPKLFQNGNLLPIPPNVWFVGTANQDETTLEFADKTYDRSHIMELQRSQESFDVPNQLKPRHPVSYQALMTSFKKAQRQYEEQAASAYEFLNATLAELLGRRFKVGWGNRLERQMKEFVPVAIAAGGSLGEACDHILATKILRKIRDRHDTPTSDLRKLKDELLSGWGVYDLEPAPEQSLAIIETEIRRLEPGED